MDETFDFVVVGSGGGSMCAGLVMREAGKSVVVLEKAAFIGGTTARSGGMMWIPNNRFMKEDGAGDSFEKAMTYFDATAGQSENAPGATRERRAAYIAEAPRMVDFLVGKGIRLGNIKYYPDYYNDRPGGVEGGRTINSELFDIAELGAWKDKLQPNPLKVPAVSVELRWLPLYRKSWRGKFVFAKVALRIVLARLLGKQLVTSGAALQGQMMKASLAAGVELRTHAAVRSFIVEDGEVKGVVAQKDGRDWRIGARLGVLVNAGGFTHNQEMRDKYLPGSSTKWTGATPGDTGEMLQELIKLGAATAQMDEVVGNHMVIPPGRENTGDGVDLTKVAIHLQIAKPHSMVVDQSGVRYLNEALSYMDFCKQVRKRNQDVPAIPSWWIMDEEFMQSYMFCGTMPGSKKPDDWYASGFLKRADTIEALAGLCGLDPATLKASVERFNTGARAGHDPDFGRGSKAYDNFLGDPMQKPKGTLGAVERAPFYAAPLVPGDISTWGGVVTDTHARVLREDGAPIPGLYATGVTTASVMGRYYVGGGSSVGPSFTFGYVAARHAADLSNEKR